MGLIPGQFLPMVAYQYLLLPQEVYSAKDTLIEQHVVSLGEPHNILFENQMDSVTERAGGQAPEECS